MAQAAKTELPAALQSQITVHQLTDAEIRTIMRDVAAESERIVRSLDGKGLRSVQARLAAAQVEAWAGVADAVRVGVGDAFDASALLRAQFDAGIFGKSGISPKYWEQSVLNQSRAGIESFLARKEFKHTLSERVYRNRALSQGQVDRAVNTGLALGKSAAEIAKDVKRFIDPRTPGGPSYAAMRLARTEVQTAFHTNAVKGYRETPWINVVKWHLSGSHARPDECNEYAEAVTFRGGQPGQWRPDDIPAKPHPNCLCFTTPVVDDLDKFARDFKNGKFDNYIEKQMGCTRG